MKIGRNDPCPCGSGKKYKKCCLGKPERNSPDVNTIPIEDSVSEFEYIADTSKNLEKIIAYYNIEDISKAIFCINSWANNRSALAQALTLNQAISNIKEFGKQSIKEYTEFITFFNTIIPYLNITCREDLTLNDFGNVKIIVDNETFPVILGTGHEQVYAAMRFLPVLADLIDKKDDLKTVLFYNRYIINALSDSNIPSSDEEYDIMFELPSEQFWLAVNRLFNLNEFSEQAKKVFSIMGYQKCPIEMRHFFVYMGACYPLYNTSILVDLYKKFLSLATKEEYHQHINLAIGQILENTFNFSDNTHSRVLIAPKIINTSINKPYTNNRLLFMTVSANKVLIAINKGDFDSDDIINAEIQLIESLHEKNELYLCETYYREELHGGYAINILADMTIQFMLIEPFTDISSHGVILGSAGERFSCSALDLIYMLHLMKSFDELFDFIEYDMKEEAQIMAIGGKSNLFFTWKNANHHIASGAIEYNFISVSYGAADDYVFNYFTKHLINYPFGLQSKMFADPLNWIVNDGEFGYSHFEHKGCNGFGGEGKMIGSSTFLFLAHNVEFFTDDDFSPNNYTALRTIDELNQRLYNRYGELFGALQFLQGKVLQILYMPLHYAKKVDHSGFTLAKNKKYVYSSIFNNTDTVIIRYAVNLDELLSAMMDSGDKRVECAYFLELLEPLRKYLQYSYVELEAIINKDSSLKKEVGVFTIEQEYYYSEMTPSIQMETQNFVKARKEIAKVCYAAGAEPGEYSGKAVTQVIRKMQTAIVKVFENQISQYNKVNLHKKALNYYATQLHEIIINLKRYSSFTDLDTVVQHELKEKTRNIREEYKRNLRTAQYLLESNLAIHHLDYISDCKNDEFENLLAFADWLVVLQDNADTCYFKDFDITINIDSEYKIDTILSEFNKLQYDQILKRKYNHEDYMIKNNETDKEYLIQCASAFLEDTGVELGTLISLLEYLQLEAAEKPFVKEVYPNVFEAPKDNLVNDFVEAFIESKEENLDKAEKALNFITLDCDKLKFLNGIIRDILPVWDREKRDNRFDVKPIIMQEGKCIFSPVVIKQLDISWKSGFLEWYLPFEIGLENVKTELVKWKKRYEDMMVQDIAEVFIEKGFNPVLPEIELSSRYPRDNFPDDLGDYDVIAVNQSKNEIWIIESKVLQKVGSIYEDQMQQKSFFFQHKDDEKFQRRIDYINNNLSKVISVLGLETEGYTVISYMVTNKLLISRYKKLDFLIISYHELMQKLEN